ncbi:restriction endonuclease [Paraburkholderia sp. GAS348]|uniref:restriction endonuclease n=1 Tax=Paraburkholderia sp. GAS348 TaxID=3035132 RepID=UPI003D24F6DC
MAFIIDSSPKAKRRRANPGEARSRNRKRPGAREQHVTAVEISLDVLLGPPALVDVVVDDLPITSLPLANIPWPRFEALCAQILNDGGEEKVRQAVQYGRPGQDQYGIDIVTYRIGAQKHIVAQCKRVRRLTAGNIEEAVNDFLIGPKASSTSKYIFCTTTTLGEETAAVDAWTNAYNRLIVANIEAELWDSARLNDLLRTRPAIVTRFFGVECARRFCDPASPSGMYPSQFRQHFVGQFENQLALEQVTTRLDVNLPCERFPHFGGILTFARADLSGISFAISAKTLLTWAQWRVWATMKHDERPYAQQSAVPGRYVLSADGVRLTLNTEEVQDLDWILCKAWEGFLQAANELEKYWRFLRFPRLTHDEQGFVVARVSRDAWRAMLDFANTHDFEKGDTSRHIFDRSAGLLKIYNPSSRQTTASVHHLVLNAVSDGEMALQWEQDSLLLIWQPPTVTPGDSSLVGPAGYWDVEHAHEWLVDTFAGWANDWAKQTQAPETRTGWFRRTQVRPPVEPFELHIDSHALLPRRDFDSPRTVSELIEFCTHLQGHFYLDKLGVPVKREITTNVLQLVLRFLSLGGEGERRYIAGKLTLRSDMLDGAIPGLIADTSKRFDLVAWLDNALRCLIQLLRNAERLAQSDIDFAVDLLLPAANRVREDLLCQAFSLRASS